MSSPKVILHWLDQSRSHRILWLLEELNVPYELKIYWRDKRMRAPKELEKVHPLGKSPVIEVLRPGQETLVVAETGRIIEYLIDTFDTEGKLTPKSEDARGEVSYWLHYTEATLQTFLTPLLVFEVAKKAAPFGSGFIVGIVTSQISKEYFGAEALKNLEYLENIAKKNNGGYFVNGQLTGADIILCFPLAESIFANRKRAASFLGQDPDTLYPNLAKWAHLVLSNPNFKKANEVIKDKQAKL